MKKPKIASNNAIELNTIKKLKEEIEQNEDVITSLKIWSETKSHIESLSKDTNIEGALLLFKTGDGYISSKVWNIEEDDMISILEEHKQRIYFNRLVGELINEG